MKGDVDVLYKVPKDLAWKHLKSQVYKSSIELAVYKACADMFIARKTIWNVMPLLTDTGCLHIWCNYNNLSKILDFCNEQGWFWDVLSFYSNAIEGERFCTRHSSAWLFVVVYKQGVPTNQTKSNMKELVTDVPLDELAANLAFNVTVSDLSLFIGDAMCLATTVKTIGRRLVVFGDDYLYVSSLLNEGLTEGVIY